MHSVHISPETSKDNPLWGDLLDHGKDLEANGLKLYSVVCVFTDKELTLVTTSKDTFLELGRMGDYGRKLLCEILEEEYAKEHAPEMTLRVSVKEGDEVRRGGMLVSRSVFDSGRVSFHISPAHP